MSGSRLGFFGKLPGHGDFVERGLPVEFKQVWDTWLQRGIASSRAVLGERWLNAYLTAPVWRFAIGAGACGDTGWAGVMVPSVDKVGRYFPLTIAGEVEAGISPFQVLVTTAVWHDAVERAALSALERPVDADELAAVLADLGGAQFGQGVLRIPDDDAPDFTSAQSVWLPLSYGSTPGHGVLALTHRFAQSSFGRGYCAWWTHGSSGVHASLIVSSSLLAAEAYVALLSDEFSPKGLQRLSGYSIGEAANAGAHTDHDVDQRASASPESAAEGRFDDLLGAAELTPITETSWHPSSDVDVPETAPPDEEIVGVRQVSSDEILAGFGSSGDETHKPMLEPDVDTRVTGASADERAKADPDR